MIREYDGQLKNNRQIFNNNNDNTAGEAMLTETAVKTNANTDLIGRSQSTCPSIGREVTLKSPMLNAVDDEIQMFVDNNHDFCKNAPRKDFSFSVLENSLHEALLKNNLQRGSILFYFMSIKGDWMSENELNERIGPFVLLWNDEDIRAGCAQLKQFYKKGNLQAAYYLLWLFKRATESTFEIPDTDSFNEAKFEELVNSICSFNLFYFLTLKDDWMSENELNARVGPFVKAWTGEDISACTSHLRKLYKNGDKQAGYYILWLYKRASGSIYVMPDKDSFNHSNFEELVNSRCNSNSANKYFLSLIT